MSRFEFFASIRGILIVVGITTGYFFLAKFGMAWSNFTSGITLVWPAAGLALFCASYFRWRYLLAIFFGSFLATQLLQFNQIFDPDYSIVGLAILMAAADTLQAFVVAGINRRYFECHFDISISRILPYVASVFISCLIACSIGSLILRYLHIIPEAEFFTNWLSWWMGDSAGMLLFTPLLLWLFRKPIRINNPKGRAFLLLSCVIGLAIFAMAATHYLERNQLSKQQELSAHRFQVALENRLELSLRDMDVMNRFYYKIYPTEKDFDELAKPLLERSPWINQLIWLPAQNIQSDAKDSAYWSFSLHKKSEANSVSDLIQFIKAQTQNRQLFASNFVLDQHKQIANFYLYHPVTACINNLDESCYFRGWIIAGIDIDQWLNYAVGQLTTTPATAVVVIAGDESSIELGYSDGHWRQQQTASLAEHQLILKTPWHLLNKSYLISLYQTPSVTSILSWLQFSTLICCLLIIGLLVSYLYSQQKHYALIAANQQKLEKDIDFRTNSLREANDWLLKEIAERQTTQELLEKSKQELYEREQHLRSLLDNIPDPVWLKNTDGTYLSCNKAFAEFLGKTVDEVVGQHQDNLVSAEEADNFRLTDKKALLNNQQPHRYEQWLFSSKGDQHLLDISKVSISNLQGDIIGVLAIARDTTEKHNLISALEVAKNTAQAATESKSRFLANMSHEIRTPLNAVLGYAQLLMRDKEIGTRQQEKLSAILTSGHKLLDLINDILDLSKIESGQLNIKRELFDLHQELSTVITVISDRARSKNLPVLIDVSIPKPFVVRGDRQKLGQILINLLSNAIKFTHRGEVRVELESTHFGVEFIISDTGNGISEQELAQLFVAFKQGSAGENMGGTGLGLNLSRHLAEAMDGNLQLQSQIGVGTKAILQLPLKQDSTQITDQFLEHSKSIKLSQSINVLVVEDDAASNQILVDLLRDVSCNVSSAFNGREGLTKAAESQFDIIFTDIRMPDINGLEMLKSLRRNSNYFTTPIIAVSASSLEHERDYYLSQDFQDFIGKPYSFDEVFNALVKFAGAEYENPQSLESTPPIEDNSTITDLSPIIDDLQLLLNFATQGDLSKTKSQATRLTPETLGKQRHLQLLTALKNYDLERVELLVKEWLQLD